MTTKIAPILLFSLAIAVFASCAREEPVASPAQENQVSSSDDRTTQNTSAEPVDSSIQKKLNWVILTKTDLSNEGSTGFQGIWQPSEADMHRVIQEARLYLEKLKKTTSSDDERENIGKILAGWDKYLCQAVGHTRNGKKLIHLNFFPNERASEEWKKQMKEIVSKVRNKQLPNDVLDWRHCYVVVCDGGAYYWRIEYDPQAKVFLNFETNGEA